MAGVSLKMPVKADRLYPEAGLRCAGVGPLRAAYLPGWKISAGKSISPLDWNCTP